MYTIVFHSATGNTKHLANKLRDKLRENTKVVNILEVKPESLCADEQLIIMYPIHGFNASKEIIKYVSNIPQKKFSKINIIAVGCNNSWLNDANSIKLRNIIIEKGYKIGVDRVLAMPLTIGVKFKREIAVSIIEEAEKSICNIGEDLIKNVTDNKVIPMKSKLIYNAGKAEKQAAKLFGLELYANNDCISCGMCANQCGAKNIYMGKNNKPKFKMNCSMCMKCIYDCPVNAIKPRFSKFVLLKEGYSLKDYL